MGLLYIIAPVLLVAIVAMFILYLVQRRLRATNREVPKNHIILWMTLGLSIGTAMSLAMNPDNLGIGMAVGMLVGLLIGLGTTRK